MPYELALNLSTEKNKYTPYSEMYTIVLFSSFTEQKYGHRDEEALRGEEAHCIYCPR